MRSDAVMRSDPVMLIVCPTCAAEYELDPERIGVAGRKVRCAGCRDSWVAHRPTAPDADDLVWEIRADDPLPLPFPEPAQAEPAAPIAPTIEIPRAETRRAPERPGRQRAASKPRTGAPRRFKRLAAVAIALGIAALPAAVIARSHVVGALPGTASLFAAAGLPVNVLGLSFTDVVSSLSDEKGAPILVVSGDIANVSGRALPVPAVEIAIEGGPGQSLYRWSVKPAEAELAPGARTTFRARLASPPPLGRRVEVTFRESGRSGAVALR